MAHREQAPQRARDPQVVRELVQSLDAHRQGGKKKGGFGCRKNTFTLPSGKTVDSWKMSDWDYKKPNLPTYARGLFTYVNRQKEHEIAIRGYDKFFNHGEVPKTEWRNVERDTRGPYELSVKENGCIIFIAGLDDGSLLVCSKHSAGSDHARVGEKWVERHLESVGKTKAQLARQLREMNATAVGELCDDEFEEHVLAYDPETAGIYLHGINLNVPEFATYPGHLVHEFAAEWGFRKAMYVMEDDIKKVKSFLDEVAETGAYQGRETEGFVIRCQARETEKAPYEDWFFKYKFEEPYLMYRQWRECTRAVIANKEPRYKKHKKITEQYLLYARRRFARDPKLVTSFQQNHGIIQLRDDFLAECGLKGSDIIRQEVEAGEEAPGNREVTKNVILVPIATIGCGKTTVALALVKLFGWGHVQNDNIQGKGNRPQRFTTAVTNAVASYEVCIADRNNHQKRERAQIIADVAKIIPDAKFVGLHWVHDRGKYDQIRRAMQHRVLSRGDNHQTIQASSKDPTEIIGIMNGFMNRFEPVDVRNEPDDRFDLVIDLDPTSDSRENLETIVSRLNAEFPRLFGQMPSANDLDDAIQAALNDYQPDIKHQLNFKDNKGSKEKQKEQLREQQNGRAAKAKPPKLEYFAVRLESERVQAILRSLFRDTDSATSQFYHDLQQSGRIQPEFHVTLIHKASAKQHADVWQKYVDLHTPAYEQSMAQLHSGTKAPPSEPEVGTCKVQLERLIWDAEVMCFVARLEGDTVCETVNPVAHVTVGTAHQGIKPVKSNDLIQAWLREGCGGESGVQELPVRGSIVLEGSLRGVLSRF